MTSHRIGVIGLGQRSARILVAMKEIGWSFEVAGVVDDAPAGAPVLQAAGIPLGRTFPSVETLLDAGPFDLVIIGSPNHLHLEHLKTVLPAGFPILCEKPIVRTEAETLELARLLAARPKGAAPLFVGLVLRSAPIVRAITERVDAGVLGKLVSIDATEHLSPEHGAYIARNWRRRAMWGGSYLLDKTCHDFDMFNRLVGARATRVASMGGRAIFSPGSSTTSATYDDGAPAYQAVGAGWEGAETPFQADMDLADHQTALVEYANGVRLSFHSNSHAAMTERRWNLIGTEGALMADLSKNRITFRRALSRGPAEEVNFGGISAESHNGADHAMARDLLAALRGEGAFRVSPWESMEAGLTVMAIDRAMALGEMLDCRPMWTEYDAARTAQPVLS
ncbi:MAG TPA: Gfo/Idh/MocA family oxidoreductase [Caulobacteraceae bacterium]|nr:Gfo/Idh/MocA family oxidoreductase [Caulobacteraceae bacterium]